MSLSLGVCVFFLARDENEKARTTTAFTTPFSGCLLVKIIVLVMTSLLCFFRRTLVPSSLPNTLLLPFLSRLYSTITLHPPLEDICVCHYVLNETGRSVPRLPGFHSPLSPSDECLHRRPDHSSVLNGDVSLSLFPGGLPVRRPPHGGRRAAVPPRSSRGRHHAQREEARGQQQQRRAVQM